MQIHFLNEQCSNCPLNINGKCDYKTGIKDTIREVILGIPMRYICKKYKTLFNAGDKVLIDLYNYRKNNDWGQPQYEWYKYIEGAEGIITGKITNHFLYSIKLIKPVKLYRTKYDSDDVVLEEVNYQLKPANKIKLATESIVEKFTYTSVLFEQFNLKISDN